MGGSLVVGIWLQIPDISPEAKFREGNGGDAKDTKERNDKQAICDKTLRGKGLTLLSSRLS